MLDLCVRCGGLGHLFEKCWWGNRHVDDRAYFLYDCRIGLGPVATTLDCSDLEAQPGVHVRDVLTREQTRDVFNNPRKPYFEVAAKKLDYSRFRTLQEEAMKVPPTPQTDRGPPPSIPTRGGDVHIPGIQLINPLMARTTWQQPTPGNTSNIKSEFLDDARPQFNMVNAMPPANISSIPSEFIDRARPQFNMAKTLLLTNTSNIKSEFLDEVLNF
ncbi:hypothetical protein E0Z10_g1647 [Xylaria hypoxylon]|uniref:Uncharacterized protein n=1 Tax=Xylaria hypoxylon TaxID=37992 RepID=A0A4Z0ZC37_9PEZI|nr:hypothetical protein E0Z10_g1647 [Xylaria hypoxylon]